MSAPAPRTYEIKEACSMKVAPDDMTNSPLWERIEARQSPDRGGLDSLTLQEIIAKYHVPGVSIAVIKDFAVDWVTGVGSSDVKIGSAVHPRTLFQAASISKPVTAMAVLKLAQDEKLSLDADVNGILKSWKLRQGQFGDTPITPRALLSHTSGAGDGFGFPGYDPADARPTLVQILEGQKPSNVGPCSSNAHRFRPPDTRGAGR
jgi:CubicO group peptidase (beta-lactamase class C family)